MDLSSSGDRSAAREPLAIIGIGCRFPGGANGPELFWRLMCNGVDAISEVPADRWNIDRFHHPTPGTVGKTNVRRGGWISGIDLFDADFFGISAREADRMDPQQRVLLEVAWEALEDAGLVASQISGSRTGVFIGLSSLDYSHRGAGCLDWIDPHSGAGVSMCIAANRISYCFNLNGPSIAMDTACSSSLVAIHLACQSLWRGESALALAGGVNILIRPESFVGFNAMLSPDGRCKAFDASANGFARAEGAGIVVLKPLAQAQRDRDRIYALVLGSATNQDGRTVGLTVPSQKAQEDLVRAACQDAGVAPAHIQYVEAHGTGTHVGDPIEARALGTVLADGRPAGDYCRLGSVKTNIGHLEPAAGVAGLIKAALVLNHGVIPPNLHFKTPNPEIPFEQLQLRVQQRLERWPAVEGPTLAGVNSFGFGGANAHVVLQGLPPMESRAEPLVVAEPAHLIPLSARSPQALLDLASSYHQYLSANGDGAGLSLEDISWTCSHRRTHHDHRLAIIARTKEELLYNLAAFTAGQAQNSWVAGRCHGDSPPKLVFACSGQGSQWWAMGRELLQGEPVFRQTIERCDQQVQSLGNWSLLEELSRSEAESRLEQTEITQPAIFAVQAALAALWRSWGVAPDAVVGHSVGEVTAAYLAGALELEQAVTMLFHRGRCMAGLQGRMMVVGLPEREVEQQLEGFEGRVCVAAVNSPTSITLAGDEAALTEIASAMARAQRYCKWVRVNYGFHSHLMDPIKDELLECLRQIPVRAARLPMISTVSGELVRDGKLDADYWWRNVRRPVRFAAAIGELLKQGYEQFLDLGPHPVLSGAISECARGTKPMVLPSLRRGEPERTTLLRSLGALYCSGHAVQWDALSPAGRLAQLPSYPWQRERHWMEAEDSLRFRTASIDHPLLGQRVDAVVPTWENRLDRLSLQYLQDHRVQGQGLLAGAVYLELALAAARRQFGPSPVVLEEVEFAKPCILRSDGRTRLQTILEPGESSFRIYSRSADNDQPWTCHATGKVRVEQTLEAALGMDNDVRDRCALEMPAAECYRRMQDHGLQYGPSFQGLDRLWSGVGEALGLIRRPASLEFGPADYEIHPALLDACLHVLSGALPDRSGTYLPIGVRQLRFHGPTQGPLWSHVRLLEENGSRAIADIQVFDQTGSLKIELRGFRLQLLDRSAEERFSEDASGLAYEYRWQLKLRSDQRGATRVVTDLPSPNRICATILDRAVRQQADLKLVELEQHFEAAVNPLCSSFVVEALRELGVRFQPSERLSPALLGDRFVVGAASRRFLERWFDLMEQDGLLRRVADEWEVVGSPMEQPHRVWRELVVRMPTFYPDLMLVGRVAQGLARILRGEVDPLEVLFPEGSMAVAEHFYQDSLRARVFSSAAQLAVSELVGDLRPGRALRILELGAGTGGMTAHVLPELPADRTEYFFTDVSAHFFQRAREGKFRDYGFLEYQRLDIEADPCAQGFEPHSFDVVVAFSVLHALADLRIVLRNVKRLLGSHGVLAIGEAVKPKPWMDFVFGLTEGWQRYADHDLRPDHPLLPLEGWSSLLAQEGFNEIAEFTGGSALSIGYAGIMARGPRVEPVQAAPSSGAAENAGRWLIFADSQGIGAELAGQLRAQGQHCEIVAPEIAGRGLGAARDFDLPLARQKLISPDSAPWRGIVHLWNCDVKSPESASDRLSAGLADGCLSTAVLAQALDEYEADRVPRLWVVTRGAQSPFSTAAPPSIAQSPVWGLCRVIGNESPKLRSTLIDLSAQTPAEEISSLCAELLLGDQEEEICLRGDQRYVARLAPFNDGAQPEIRHLRGQTEDPSFRLEIERPGTLDNLILRETSRCPPGPGELEIRVVAAGVNFKDVMKALGLVSGQTRFSGECAGVISAVGPAVEGWQIGEEVVALAKQGHGSFVTTRADYVTRKPPHLSFEEAATWPVVFGTGHLALNHLGRLSAGERVLIHSASGGVGLAAIQLAQRVGAEIFATAGTAEKREFLRALGIRHVMDSRSLAFADQVLEATDGQGVDLVLNSLPGEAIAKGLSVLRDYGRFLEIGKRDIDQNHRLGLRPFSKQLSFFAVDVEAIIDSRPELASRLLQELSAWFWDGSLAALPFRVFPISRAVEALRYMSQARHIGKIVLSLRPQKVTCWRARSASAPALHRDATYLITGGCGGFGLAVAQWMVAQGAGHLLLLGRSGASSAAAQDAVEKMRQAGAEVIIAQTDVADEEQLARLLAEIKANLPPLRGVFHAAMVIKDCLVSQLDLESLREVWRPKVDGAWNLHRLTAGMELDYFVLFSSLASVVGPGGQASYASANAFLDALARYRRAVGLPAVSIGWGALEEVGWVARNSEIQERLNASGLRSFTVSEALEQLGRALHRRPVHLVVTRFDPQRAAASFRRLTRFSMLFAETVEHQVVLHKSAVRATLLAAEPGPRRELLTSLLRERVARALGTAPDKVDSDKGLTQLGLDSLMGVELRNWVEDELKLSLSMLDLLGGLSVERLAELLDQQLPHAAADSTRPETEAEPLLNRTDDVITDHQSVDQPLSFGQERLWFLDRLEPGNPAYVERMGLRIREHVDSGVMQRVVDEMCRRHESLRTTFHLVEGRPIQRIAHDATIAVRTVNLGSLSTEEAEAQLRLHITEESQDPLDLARGPLLRMTLLRFGENDTVWLSSAHHILIDATSRRVMLREVRELYQAFVAGQPSPLPEPRARYADFVRWQRSELAGPRLEQLLSYWRQKLHGPLLPLELPTDRIRPAQFSYRGADLQFELGEDLVSDLQALGRTRTVTPFMILLAAFNALLYRYTGQEDFVVASPITGRERVEFEDLIGFFVNTLVLRSDLSGDPTFEQLLDRTRQVALEAYDQRALPFERILQLLPERELSRVPLAQVAFTFEPPEIAEAGLGIDLIAVPSIAAKFDLMLLIQTRQGRMYCTFEYCTDLFDASTIRRMAEHFTTLLAGAVHGPTLRLSRLPLAGETELEQVLVSGTGPRIDYPEPAAIHRIFESQANLRPDAVALMCEAEVMTYGELNAAANRWGRYLQSLGVGSGVAVGLIGERRCRMVVATLAVLKAGGVCVPLDPTAPQERLAFFLENARVGIVLSDHALSERLASSPVKIVLMDAEPDLVNELGFDNLPTPIAAEDLAYVFFTSGSTGTPKGVEVMHRGIVRVCFDEQIQLGPEHVTLQLSAPTFDYSLFELWAALLRGGRCVLFPGAPLTSLQRLSDTITSFGVNTLLVTPTLFNTVIDECPGLLEPVKELLIGGEALSVSHVRRALELLPGTRMMNCYGPTEASVNTTYGPIERDLAASCRSIPIGRPLANTQVYILDRHLNLMPIGVPGELYAGGDGLARGYLGLPGLTAEKFIANPFGDGQLYRTGDLARWLPDGSIEFLGRVDRQLKLRGHRIEPGEIETAILKNPDVLQAVVAMRQDDGAGRHLVAYVVPAGRPPAEAELRQMLGQRLPDYMIPARFVIMDTLPLMANGKVDQRLLPAPESSRGRVEMVPPRSQLEREIAQVWQQLLKVDRVGVHDNFFDLGGHSLMVVEAHYRLSRLLNGEPAVMDFFRYPTVAALASFWSRKGSESHRAEGRTEHAEARRSALKRQRQLRQAGGAESDGHAHPGR